MIIANWNYFRNSIRWCIRLVAFIFRWFVSFFFCSLFWYFNTIISLSFSSFFIYRHLLKFNFLFYFFCLYITFLRFYLFFLINSIPLWNYYANDKTSINNKKAYCFSHIYLSSPCNYKNINYTYYIKYYIPPNFLRFNFNFFTVFYYKS